MGYYVYITRATNSDAAWKPHENAIQREEWLAIARADPKMRVLPSGPILGSSVPAHRNNVEGDEVWWTALPDINDEGVVWFSYVKPGFIQVKFPNEEILHKMHQIALQLGARVVGEEDEEYGENGSVTKPSPHEQPQPRSKSWWQRLFGL